MRERDDKSDDWDDYEESGPTDLEDLLETELERHFPRKKPQRREQPK